MPNATELVINRGDWISLSLTPKPTPLITGLFASQYWSPGWTGLKKLALEQCFSNYLWWGASPRLICFQSSKWIYHTGLVHVSSQKGITCKFAQSLPVQVCWTDHSFKCHGKFKLLQISNAVSHCLYLSPRGVVANSSQMGSALRATVRVAVVQGWKFHTCTVARTPGGLWG